MGPFVNRNHFALFCVMLAPPALGLIVTRRGQWRHTGEARTDEASAAAGGHRAGAIVCQLVLRAVFVAALFALGAAVLLSLSRSGFLALTGAVVVTVLLSLRASSLLTAASVLILLGGLIAGFVFFPAPEVHRRLSTLREADETPSAQTRFEVWRNTAAIWRDHPLVGCGPGSFRNVYPLYKTSDSRKGALHAENEYLEVLAEMGLVGTGLVLFAAVAFVRAVRSPEATRGAAEDGAASGNPFANRRRMSTWRTPWLTVAGGALAGVLIHCFFDFGLRVPVNLAVIAALLGLAVDARPQKNKESRLTGRMQPTGRRMLRIQLGLLFFTILVLGWVYRTSAWKLDDDLFLHGADTATVGRALRWSPTRWSIWYELGRRVFLLRTRSSELQAGAYEETWQNVGLAFLRRAAALNRRNYKVWEALAEAEYASGHRIEARKAAEKVLELRSYKRSQMRKYLKKPEKTQ